MNTFKNIEFIKPNTGFSREYVSENIAPLFRKKFFVEKKGKATIYVCMLGYGYCYINGENITNDLFTAAVSDYNKTLWYNKYDVSKYIKKGENVIAVILGNGFFNETFATQWNHYKASWRDNPKFIARLDIDGETVLKSDDTFKCQPQSAVVFNQLRSGEYFDANRYDKNWNRIEYDDNGWERAKIDDNAPKGVFRECLAQPIRECGEFPAVKVWKTGDKRYLFDIGQNISGYVRLKVKAKKGQEIVIRHAEEKYAYGALRLNNLNILYPDIPFQTDKIICNGKSVIWRPLFTYHGFRYVEVEGLSKPPEKGNLTGIFVHQDIEQLSDFECSSELLNKIYRCGILSTYSNLHYTLTDCPTREKLGWTNDIQASVEQMMINFDAKKFFEKFIIDMQDAMRDDGALPGIVPSPNWGYDNGPVADGALFEIPYRIYQYSGDGAMLKETFPYFKKFISYLEKFEKEGRHFALADWNGMFNLPTPIEFIEKIYFIIFLQIMLLGADLVGEDRTTLQKKLENRKKDMKSRYIKDGKCIIEEQTAVSLLIALGLYDDILPLKQQLRTLIDKATGHFNCGMVGIQYIFDALSQCGLHDYAYKIITADGAPGYKKWIDSGATTLWETWRDGYTDSRNHHMFSCVLAFLFKTYGGINVSSKNKGFTHIEIAPHFERNLDFCKVNRKVKNGNISVSWHREKTSVKLEIEIPKGVSAVYDGKILPVGKSEFVI